MNGITGKQCHGATRGGVLEIKSHHNKLTVVLQYVSMLCYCLRLPVCEIHLIRRYCFCFSVDISLQKKNGFLFTEKKRFPKWGAEPTVGLGAIVIFIISLIVPQQFVILFVLTKFFFLK